MYKKIRLRIIDVSVNHSPPSLHQDLYSKSTYVDLRVRLVMLDDSKRQVKVLSTETDIMTTEIRSGFCSILQYHLTA